MTTELEPCPFCAGPAEVVIKDVEPQGDPWYGGKLARFVQCQKCGCSLFDGFLHEGFSDAAAAVDAWNKRVLNDFGGAQ